MSVRHVTPLHSARLHFVPHMASSMYRIANTSPCLRLKSAVSNATFPKYYSVDKSIHATAAANTPLCGATTAALKPAGPPAIGLSFSGKSGSRGLASLTGSNYGNASILLSRNLLTAQLKLNSPRQQQHQQQQQSSRNFSSLQMPLQYQRTKLVPHNAMAPLRNRRYISSKEITKNMTLYTNGPFNSEVDQKTLEFKKPSGNPLVLMMAWLMAKQKHLKKCSEIYTDMGFDVMVVQITPWQLLWPVKGTQVVAAEVLKFLENNKSYAPIVVHGYSVGAYQFGEIMIHMARDMDRYKQVLDRIACQVWDSAADITEIPVGVPKSIFPRNPRMQSALRNYTLYHLKTFHNQATVHYMRSSQIFHSTLVKKPALFFVAKNDLIGRPESNQSVRENWERANIKVTFKCWDHSLHASHMVKHREEYLDVLYKHLESCGVLESVGLKKRAKL